MKPLNVLANFHGKERARGVISASGQFFQGRGTVRSVNILFCAKIQQYFIGIKRQHDLVAPDVQERENIGKVARRLTIPRRGTASETRNLLSETEESWRFPEIPGNAKPRKRLRTQIVV
jgi:hypothetical protein